MFLTVTGTLLRNRKYWNFLSLEYSRIQMLSLMRLNFCLCEPRPFNIQKLLQPPNYGGEIGGGKEPN